MLLEIEVEMPNITYLRLCKLVPSHSKNWNCHRFGVVLSFTTELKESIIVVYQYSTALKLLKFGTQHYFDMKILSWYSRCKLEFVLAASWLVILSSWNKFVWYSSFLVLAAPPRTINRYWSTTILVHCDAQSSENQHCRFRKNVVFSIQLNFEYLPK